MGKKIDIGRAITSVAGVILCIILIPVLVLNITLVAKSYINPDEVPAFFGIKPFVVLTGSMEDTIGAGDLIITREVDPSTLLVGDIVSYRTGSSVITHRILELTEVSGEPAFITQGDANNAADERPVTYDQVESIFVRNIPKLGNAAMFMQTTRGMLISIGGPVALFILYDVLSRRRSNKRVMEEQAETQAELDDLKRQLALAEGKTAEDEIRK